MRLKRSVQVAIITSLLALVAALALPAVADDPEPVDPPVPQTGTLTIASGTDWVMDGSATPVAVDCTGTSWGAAVPGPWTKSIAGTWIWSESCPATSFEAFHTFSKTFDIPGTVTGATMQVSADNELAVLVNGATVGSFGTYPSSSAHTTAHSVDPTSALVAGSNTVTLDVRNWPWPCGGTCNPGGAVASLTVTYEYYAAPTAIEHCNDGGWQQFSDPSFVHQGDCVSYVMTKGKNQPGIGNDEHPDGVGKGVNKGGGKGGDGDEGSDADTCTDGDEGSSTDLEFRNHGDCVSHDATDGENPPVVDGDDSANSDGAPKGDGSGEGEGEGDSDGDAGGSDGGNGHDTTHVDNGTEDNGHEEGHDDSGQNGDGDDSDVS